jgi:hypothetical protein
MNSNPEPDGVSTEVSTDVSTKITTDVDSTIAIEAPKSDIQMQEVGHAESKTLDLIGEGEKVEERDDITTKPLKNLTDSATIAVDDSVKTVSASSPIHEEDNNNKNFSPPKTGSNKRNRETKNPDIENIEGSGVELELGSVERVTRSKRKRRNAIAPNSIEANIATDVGLQYQMEFIALSKPTKPSP